MHISSSLSLAVIGTISSLAYGFSLQPLTTKNYLAFQSNDHPPSASYGFKRMDIISTSLNRDKGDVGAFNFNGLEMRGGGKARASSLALALSTHAADARGGSSSGTAAGASALASLWGAGGVIMILGKSIKRILPIALEPFGASAIPLSTLQLGAYISMCLWFAYVEGYKGFQLKFSPLVVARSQTLTKNSPIHHTLLAPFYAMGLFHATKKRKIVSWSVSIGVGMIVAAVKRLPYPYRNIVDAGVIVGLTWGSVSIGVEWIKAVVLGIEPSMDPALPGKQD